MISVCKAYVEQVLKGMGLARIYDKVTAEHRPVPYAVVTPGEAKLSRNGRKVARETDSVSSIRRYRRRMVDVSLPIEVLIVGKDEAGAEALAVEFCARLQARILDPGGNAILVEPATMEVFEDTSILKSESGVLVVVDFLGGIYRDDDVPLVSVETLIPEIAKSEV